jgi:hypothetical protein
MNEEDKQLIAKYMGWKYGTATGNYYNVNKNDVDLHYFNLNDAALCVKKMKGCGDDWPVFFSFAMCVYEGEMYGHEKGYDYEYIYWLFNADNFFSAMVEWLRRKRYERV